MRAIVIAIGNVLRRDDGAAHRVVGQASWPVQCAECTRICAVTQLTPELAEEISTFDRVLFIDADITAGAPRIEPICDEAHPVLGHSSSPAQIVGLAARLYGFRGSAFLCRVPGKDFGPGEGLSPTAEANVIAAADLAAFWLQASLE